MQIGAATELKVYRMAYALAMEIFRLSKSWPPEEKYSLTDQVRRASRGVCAKIREAWSQRRYEAHFISKLTDADGENGETGTWLDFAKDCGYLADADYDRLTDHSPDSPFDIPLDVFMWNQYHTVIGKRYTPKVIQRKRPDMNASRMTSKGQVTIPRELREGLGLQPGDEVRFVATPEGIRIEKWIPGSPFADYRGFLTHLRGTGVDQMIDDLRGPVEL